MRESTADICDQYRGEAVVVDGLPSFGRPRFAGVIETVRVRADNTLVRDVLSTPGNGKVLVVDGGALPFALVGDKLATIAVQNGWVGVIVNGFVRDTAALREMPLGVLALGARPCRSFDVIEGERNVDVEFLGATFRPGEWLCADEDGVVIAPRPLVGA